MSDAPLALVVSEPCAAACCRMETAPAACRGLPACWKGNVPRFQADVAVEHHGPGEAGSRMTLGLRQLVVPERAAGDQLAPRPLKSPGERPLEAAAREPARADAQPCSPCINGSAAASSATLQARQPSPLPQRGRPVRQTLNCSAPCHPWLTARLSRPPWAVGHADRQHCSGSTAPPTPGTVDLCSLLNDGRGSWPARKKATLAGINPRRLIFA